MDNSSLNYYKESGVAQPINIGLTLACAFATLLCISYFYSLIINFIPIVYLNFLIVILYGYIVSYTSRIFNTIFKIRNRNTSITITCIIAVFAVYFQWVSYLYIISMEDFNPSLIFKEFGYFFNIFFRPDLVVLEMIEINKIGLWSLYGVSYINGLPLWLVWFAEAAIIIYVAIKSFSSFEIIPFSEKDNTWFKKEFIDFDFERITFKNKFLEAFILHPSKAILDLHRGDGLRHSKISIFSSETESKSIITIDNIIITKSGKGSKDVSSVLKHCYIDNIHLSKLRAQFRTKKASIFDY
ncbi:hypothetical protein ACKGJY_13820 [Hyunsoonleella sp. 2307UL5-6]|uniref:hypothetical protein n=1 Tax=Hyunsoonleella sp. 2307UL5-6 TaxID=3384768 RepID=UPI0039BCA902